MTSKKLPIELKLENLQRQSFDYFLHEANPANGLVVDKTAADWPARIVATGLALAAYRSGGGARFHAPRCRCGAHAHYAAFFLEQCARL